LPSTYSLMNFPQTNSAAPGVTDAHGRLVKVEGE
jgi:hypothetical protein